MILSFRRSWYRIRNWQARNLFGLTTASSYKDKTHHKTHFRSIILYEISKQIQWLRQDGGRKYHRLPHQFFLWLGIQVFPVKFRSHGAPNLQSNTLNQCCKIGWKISISNNNHITEIKVIHACLKISPNSNDKNSLYHIKYVCI